MKKLLLSIMLLPIAGAAIAQTGTVTGVVKNQEGDLLHFAYVQNDQHKGAFTDSLGNFTIAAAPNSTLHINCDGYLIHRWLQKSKFGSKWILACIV